MVKDQSIMRRIITRVTTTIWRILWVFLLRPLGLFILTGGIISLFRYALSAWSGGSMLA
ncbi:hypothetical protein BJY01DRAFT_185348 [Aspergillus pseudoustus]|uniref:Uncharacterized protein n=1 Tax=Aspergillus pseudoustus TaxID=1810923 RepID=A0ABR4JYH4_9EURO